MSAPLREETLYVGHLTALKDELTAEENLRSLVSLSGIDPDETALRAALASVALEAQRLLPARVLSQGQRRRIGLARLSLLQRPLWLLDEPATALDSTGLGLLGQLDRAAARGRRRGDRRDAPAARPAARIASERWCSHDRRPPRARRSRLTA